MKECPVVYFEKLVKDYNDSLATILRGFKPGFDFLETWVPSEDDSESILNLIESAYESRVEELELILEAPTHKKLSLEALKADIQKLGRVIFELKKETLVLKISFEIKEALNSVNAVYQEKLKEVLKNCSHEGDLSEASDVKLVKVSYQGLMLMAHVTPTTHVVKKASFQGATIPLHRGLLEKLCSLMEGKTIQECSEHACIYLEFELRDSHKNGQAQGIVMPENADPAFLVPLRLVRELFKSYKEISGYKDIWNFSYPMPSLSWRSLKPEEKKNQLINIICEFCKKNELPPTAIKIVSIDNNIRVTLSFEGMFTSMIKQKILMELEYLFKRDLEKTLEVYTEELKDKNLIRRLTKSEKISSLG